MRSDGQNPDVVADGAPRETLGPRAYVVPE